MRVLNSGEVPTKRASLARAFAITRSLQLPATLGLLACACTQWSDSAERKSSAASSQAEPCPYPLLDTRAWLPETLARDSLLLLVPPGGSELPNRAAMWRFSFGTLAYVGNETRDQVYGTSQRRPRSVEWCDAARGRDTVRVRVEQGQGFAGEGFVVHILFLPEGHGHATLVGFSRTGAGRDTLVSIARSVRRTP